MNLISKKNIESFIVMKNVEWISSLNEKQKKYVFLQMLKNRKVDQKIVNSLKEE